MKRIILVICLLVSGCASEIMKSYIGKDLREVVMDYGSPQGFIDLDDGTRAYQWSMTQSYTSPAYITSTGSTNGSIIGTGNMYNLNATQNTQSYVIPSRTSTNECLYTLYAKKGKTKDSWIITGFRRPKFSCE